MTVERFCARLGIPRSTWYYRRDAHRAGRTVHHWPAPVVDALEDVAEAKAHKYSAWGHRKIWAMLRADGYQVSQSSVKRAMSRRDLLQPRRYHAEVRALAKARRAVFTTPPVRRNRVWQTDFSEYETEHGGFWQLSGYVDYTAKFALALDAFGTKTAHDALTSLKAAIAAAEAELGHSLAEDCVNKATGEIVPLVIVSDNGACYKAAEFAAFIAARPWLYHVRTRFRSPWTNGVIERFFQTVKYEGLFRHEITNGYELGKQLQIERATYNDVRPHEHLDFDTPRSRYLGPQPVDDELPHLPGTGPPINYNPEPPRPRTRRPPGPPRTRKATNPEGAGQADHAATAAGVKASSLDAGEDRRTLKKPGASAARST
jgi:transposase InsO family protein